MNRQTATEVPDQTFLDALAGAATVRVLGLDNGDLWSVYAGQNLVGVVDSARWARILERAAGVTRHQGASADQTGDPPDTIGAARGAALARLQADKGRLEAAVEAISARIAAI